jgi:hypothetical protein
MRKSKREAGERLQRIGVRAAQTPKGQLTAKFAEKPTIRLEKLEP